MAKRIYTTDSRLVKYAAISGAIGIPTIVLIFYFLASLGTLTITGMSGDIICTGAADNPCVGYINFTNHEDWFMYPGNWSEGLVENGSVDNLKFYRSWGTGWREINLSDNCKGTWCGAPDNSGNTKYSIAFRKDRNYSIKYEFIKLDPSENVRINFVGETQIYYGLNGESLQKSYDNKTKTLSFNSKIDGTKKISMSLQTAQVENVIYGKNRTIAIFNIENNYGDYPLDLILGSMQLINLDTNETFDREYYFKYQKSTGFSDVPVYKEICAKEILENKTEIDQGCAQIFDHFYHKENFGLFDINKSEVSHKGNSTIAIVMDVLPRERGEWLPTYMGILSPEFASWQESWNTNIAHGYTFEDISTNLPDIIGAKNGVKINTPSNITGCYGNGASFVAGDSDYFNWTSSPLNEGANITFLIWINSTDFSANQFLFGKYQTQGETWGRFNTRQFTVAVYAPAEQIASSNATSLSDNYYHPYIAQYGSMGMYLWQNGVLVGYSSTTQAPSSDYNFFIGGRMQSGGAIDFGTFHADESYVWSRYLSESEIVGLNNSGSCLTYVADFDNAPFQVEILAPPNGTKFTEQIQLTFNVSDDVNTTFTTQVYVNTSGWTLNVTNSSTLNATATNMSIGLHNGANLVGVYAIDYLSQTNYSTNRTYFLDTINPAGEYAPSSDLSGIYSRNFTFINASFSDNHLSTIMLEFDGANESFASTAGNSSWSNKTNLADGNHTARAWANDTFGRYTFLGVLNFSITANAPGIAFTSPTKNNATAFDSTLQTWIEANVSINATNRVATTFTLFNSSGLVNQTIYWDATNFTNWTGLPDEAYYYNVTVNQSTGSQNSTETRVAYITKFRLFINNVEGNTTAELNSTLSIIANSTAGLPSICLDVIHPDYGNNYSCSSSLNLNVSIPYFRNLNFSDSNTSKVITHSSFSRDDLNFSAHQYDEVDSLTINATGVQNPYDLILFLANTTPDTSNQTQYEPLIDRFFQGYLNGSDILVSQFYDNSNAENLSFAAGGDQYLYFLVDDILATRNLGMFYFDVVGYVFGFDYTEGNSTTGYEGFENYSNIYTVNTNAQLDVSGVIMPKNTTQFRDYYDTFSDGVVNQNLWTNTTCTVAGSTTNCVDETGGQLRIQTTLADPYGSGTSQVASLDLSRFESDSINLSIVVAYDGTEHSTGETTGNASLAFGGLYIWNLTTVDAIQPFSGESADASLIFQLTKINRTFWGARIWGTENATGDGSPSSPSQKTYSGTLKYIPVTSSTLLAETTATKCGNCGGSSVFMYINEVNYTQWTRENSTVISQSVYDTSGNLDSATAWLWGVNANGESISFYLSPDNGNTWEAVSNGVSHSFSATGSNLRWRADFNITGSDNRNSTTQLWKVNISIPSDSPSNITFDFGDDGTVDDSLATGDLTTLQQANLSYMNISNAIISANQFTNLGDPLPHTYKIPLVVHSDSRGIVEIKNISLKYDPNPIVLNASRILAVIVNGTNRTSFSIPIAFANSTGVGAQTNFSDIRFDYAGGNKTILLRLHDPLYTLNKTFNATEFYSRWDYSFIPDAVNYIFFGPQTPTSKNVTPYGQNNNTAILNITNLGYNEGNATLSIYLNGTISCVNTTLSLTQNKTDGVIINQSWTDLLNLTYLQSTDVYLWSDYSCNYSNWYIYNPQLYFRQCYYGGVCSTYLP